MKRAALSLLLLAALAAAPAARATPAQRAIGSALGVRLASQVGAPVPPGRKFSSSFALDADGYRVKVGTTGNAVILEVFRDHRRLRTETAYVARGVSTPERLQATFGQFGRVSMRFRPRPRGKRSHEVCRHGQRIRVRPGRFVGSFELKGEGGYVTVRTHRVKGEIRTPAGSCPHRHHHFDFSIFLEQPAGVGAVAREGVDATAFFTFRLGGKTSYFATREESRGRLAIIRYALLRKGKPFHINETATAVKLRPPAPFHGAGLYRAAPDGTSTWSGNLSVNFPGAPRFPLTGPEFQALLEAPF